MKRITKPISLAVVCTMLVVSVYQPVSACQVDVFYNTKDGALAASTPETLNAAIKLEEQDNTEKLAVLMKSGTVIRLTGNTRVEVLERSIEFRMLKIMFSDRKPPYWVKDGSLTQINCN